MAEPVPFVESFSASCLAIPFLEIDKALSGAVISVKIE